MTTISEQIRTDLKEAMKTKDTARLNTLRGLLSAATNEVVAQGGNPQDDISDEIALTVIKRSAKQRKDAIAQYEQGGRNDLVDTEQAELAILEQYLPDMMSREDIQTIAKQKKEELGVTDASKAGVLVGAVMKECAGNADGAVVKEVVSSLFE